MDQATSSCSSASRTSTRATFFFFNDTATTEIYTLSLHDALPISGRQSSPPAHPSPARAGTARSWVARDRKSTRLNSSHSQISYAVFCLKKKKQESDNHSARHDPASARPVRHADWTAGLRRHGWVG